MPVARRPLLTATAAGSLLCALWFVPSANATADGESGHPDRARSGASASGVQDADGAEGVEGADGAARDGRDARTAGGAPAAPLGGGTGDVPASDGVRTDAGDDQPGGAQGLTLAATGSVDTTPYLVGGTLFLVIGAGFVSHAARRSGGRPV
ncbi:hypothetical protein OTC26_019310 [Streptomyces tirandamycinicus]|uniref:hypothetical protein n=1 Tax=Streptomyces tirandamycinicus TaxID=2174846 RepID=UPI00226D5B90|nr:hypothetical protein [Streptomyces tirandamycinicus]MCY0983532.1 hypothetical protein [Streptomyces tirandamycinicus]